MGEQKVKYFHVFVCGFHYATFPEKSWSQAWDELTKGNNVNVYSSEVKAFVDKFGRIW